ncbi:MAG: hypothetical protein KF713_10200 [Turneriella sp.]|nr:hypothetical protein [Turneriella sp.]
MGLRERASDYSKAVEASRGVDLGLELKPDLNKPKTAEASATPAAAAKTPAPEVQKAIVAAADFPATMGHKSRLDSILNLIEIYKEFGQVRSAADLWQVVAYSLMAQLGTKYIAIFMEDDTRMDLKYALGFTLASDHSFAATNKLCEALAREKKPILIDDFLASFSEREVKFLGSLGARYAAPVFRYEQLRGVMLINPPQGSSLLSADDLFYLKICGELLGAMEAQLKLVSGAEEKNRKLTRAQQYQDYAGEFVQNLGRLDNHESLRDVLEAELIRHFPETAYLLMAREDFFLRRHFAAGFPIAEVAHLEVNLVDPIVEKIKNGQTVFAPADFDGSEGFAFLAKYRQIFAHKVLHRQEILAVAFIADDEKEKVTALNAMTDHYVMQNHVARLRDHATSALKHADNPVMAIRNFITSCEEHLAKAEEPYAVIVTSLMNYTRLQNLHGDSFAAEIRDFTRKTLREIMEAQDFSTEAFHGHFVSVLRQKEAGDAWRLSRMLQKQAGKSYPDEDRRPIYQHKIYARPHIQTIPFELLFKS